MRNINFNKVVSISLVLSLAIKLIHTINFSIREMTLDDFPYTEFLINFQGGFVRRGLLGELMFQLYSLHAYPIKGAIVAISFIAFFSVLAFFFRKFRNNNYCWWLILSPLFLNFTQYIVRKDFILYLILISTLYLLVKKKEISNIIGATVLTVFALFLHEAYIFWGYPVFALVLIAKKQNRYFNLFNAAVPLMMFVLMSSYKGNATTAHNIVDSWNNILPEAPLSYTLQSSIGALGWDSIQTFIMHFKGNMGNGALGIVVTPFYILAAYYMFSNFILVWNKTSNVKEKEVRLSISVLYSFSIICLIPMFTVLSCDIGRIFQYASIATFSTFLIIPQSTILASFPSWYVRRIENFNIKLNSFITPSKGLMVVLLFILGVSTSGFSPAGNWWQSIVGTLWSGLTDITRALVHIIL